jgi:superfamily II DNA/RNA helicase
MTGAKFVDMGIDPRTARAITEVMGYEYMTVVQVRGYGCSSWTWV